MGEVDPNQKEEWAWDSFGPGVMQYAKDNPARDIVFIHRQHDGNIDHILKHFAQLNELPNVRMDLSCKYSEAHAHSTVTPSRRHRTGMEQGLGKYGILSWLTVRNDDFFFLHWAEPPFVRDYLRGFPQIDKYVNGFYIGAAGWVFGRDFTSKNPYYKERMDHVIDRIDTLGGDEMRHSAVHEALGDLRCGFRVLQVHMERDAVLALPAELEVRSLVGALVLLLDLPVSLDELVLALRGLVLLELRSLGRIDLLVPRQLSGLALLVLRFALACVALLPPTFLMGGTLPLLASWAVEKRQHVGARVGALYAANTWGAVLGAGAAGFVLILLLGVRGTLFSPLLPSSLFLISLRFRSSRLTARKQES